jgi:oligopeptide/dipeptide ABC transporter ATP-binding protein
MGERTGPPLLVVEDLTVEMAIGAGRSFRPVDGVSFELGEGASLGVTGESGAGKSTLALALIGLLDPAVARIAGRILLRGRDLVGLPAKERRALCGRELSIVFQDPHAALNPVLTIGAQVAEAVRAHQRVSRAEARNRALEALRDVEMPAPAEVAEQYPHQLSGGMRQRALMAMALVHRPALVIADEPTRQLDGPSAAAIAELLGRRVGEGLALIWISHDLSLLEQQCRELLVMYAGRAIERGPTRELFQRPAHPYARALLQGPLDGGEPPDLHSPPPGCRYEPRCVERELRCRAAPPPLAAIGPLRWSACVHAGEVLGAGGPSG